MNAKSNISPSTSHHGEKSIPQYQADESPNHDIEAGRGQAAWEGQQKKVIEPKTCKFLSL